MNPTLIQFIILAAAYVLAALLIAASAVLTIQSQRALRAMDTKRSVLSRLTVLENEMNSHRDLVTRLSRRWNKRLRDEQAEPNRGMDPDPSNDAPAMDEDERLRHQILRRFGGGMAS